MADIITRKEWGAQPAESKTAWDPDDLVGVCVHHFAVPRSATTRTGSAALMRSVQRSHQAGEFSDIAYNFCFDKFGQVFEGRGFGFQTGANGNGAVNRTHAAICYMGNSDLDGFPDVAQKAAAWLLKQWFSKGTGMDVVPHSHLSPDGTACPGAKARTWVTTGAWKADLPSTARQVQFLLLDDGVVVDKSTRVPLAQSKGRWDKFIRSDAADKAHAHMAAEGKRGTVQFVRKVTVAP
jgi:hypothetical protein